jgi:hypothetical protein
VSRLPPVRSRDTNAAALRAQVEVYRRMSAADRFLVAMEMSEEARQISATGIRARHPEYQEREVHFALIRLVLGDELFRRAFPQAPLVAP